MQKALGPEFAYFGTRMEGWIRNLGLGIWDFKREKKGVGRGGDGDFATGVFALSGFCNARREVGLLHNWAPEWWKRFAKADSGNRKVDEETRGIGAAGLSIERHPALQKWPAMCEKTTKTGVLAAKRKR